MDRKLNRWHFVSSAFAQQKKGRKFPGAPKKAFNPRKSLMEFSQIIFIKQLIPSVGLVGACFVGGPPLLVLLLISDVCLLKGGHWITIRLLDGRRWTPLIAVLLLICGWFRLLALGVWMDFIIRIWVVVGVGEARLHIVSCGAACSYHPLIVVLAVVSFVRVVGRRVLRRANWIRPSLPILLANILLDLIRLAQSRIIRWFWHSEIPTFRRTRRVGLHANNVAPVPNNN